MSDFSPALDSPTNAADASSQDGPTPSRFDDFGGHYSVLVDGVEVARWAPSNVWSEYAAEIADRPGWSYVWVATDDATANRGA